MEVRGWIWKFRFNPLTPNDPYNSRTAPLTSKRFILYIYSTNMGTYYFKHGIYYPFFSSSKCSLFHNSNVFVYCIIYILYTGCAKIKKNNSGSKRLMQFSQEGTRFYDTFVYTKVGDLTVWPAVGVLTVVCALWNSANNKLFFCRNTTLCCGVAKPVALIVFNSLTPNDPYSWRTTLLTSKVSFIYLFNKYRYWIF
jgi:hypothetical protein